MPDQKPTVSPAAYAAPRAVVSNISGLTTGTSRKISLKLHERAAVCQASVYSELLYFDCSILFHCIEDILHLERCGLQRCTCYVSAGCIAGKTHDDTPCITSPVRGEQSAEGRYHIDPSVIAYTLGEGINLGRALYDLKVIT